MHCNEVNLLILSHLDGPISNEDDAVLAEHLAGCEACARELALHRRLSGALREMGREDIQAPPELYDLVMGKLRAERRPFLWRLPAGWRSAVAAAAAVLLLAVSSAGVTVGLKMADNGKMIVYEPAPKVSDDSGGGLSPTDQAPGSGASQQGDPTRSPEPTGSPGSVPEENPTGSVSGSETGTSDVTGQSTEAGTAMAVLPSVEGPRAFLASELKIRSTVLKVAVDDLTEARAKSVAMAAGAGALIQVFPEGEKVVMMRLTVTSDYAPQLVADLARTGSLIDREDGSNNVTNSYNETVIQYNDLQSRLSAARDAEEQRQLQSQAASCKQLLDAWQVEAGKRVITLWLESK